jgi:hypothetical protein
VPCPDGCFDEGGAAGARGQRGRQATGFVIGMPVLAPGNEDDIARAQQLQQQIV